MRRATRIGTLTVIAVAAMPGSAQAATTVSTTNATFGREVVVTGDTRDNRISFEVLRGIPDADSADLLITDLSAGPQQPLVVLPGADRCVRQDDYTAMCKIVAPGVSYLHGAQVNGEAGDDSIDATTGREWTFQMTLAGGDGNDVVTFGSSPGAASGGAGDDVIFGGIYGNRIDAGAGNDVVVGGWGNDEIDAGPGQDRVSAQVGEDKVVSQDGEADTIECGGDADSVRADQLDGLAGCETTGVLVTPDADADGVAPPADCDDADPAIKPGQNEIAGNGKDDDCVSGDAATTAIVRATLVSAFKVRAGHTRVTRLALRSVEPGVSVQLRCRGKGCPFARRAVATGKRGGQLLLSRHVRRARFRGGARLEVRITKAGAIGKVIRISFRKGRSPSGAQLCLPPEARVPAAC